MPLKLVTVLITLSILYGCIVNSVCFNDADCKKGQVCWTASGVCTARCASNGDCEDGYFCDQADHVCKEAECWNDRDCGDGFECKEGQCVSETPLNCPEGMVAIERRFCIDKYEASRPDATVDSEGVSEAYATSRPNVIPWRVDDNAQAARACKDADKSLCTEKQWFDVCQGTKNTVYSYGNDYDPSKCNGIDTFCYCDPDQTCGARDDCPFPSCYDKCGADVHLEPTGKFPDCVNDFGVFDMNGNVWEHVLGGDDTRIRGGAYNCLDSKKLHRCDYIPGSWAPSARGFRCCSEGSAEAADAGVEIDAGTLKASR